MIIFKEETTTKSGCLYLTQFAIDENEEIISQVDDARKQIEYEVSQLL